MHRLVKQLFELIGDQPVSKFSKEHLLNENTVRTWRRKANPVSPQLRVFDEILNKIGYRLVIEKKEQVEGVNETCLEVKKQ